MALGREQTSTLLTVDEAGSDGGGNGRRGVGHVGHWGHIHHRAFVLLGQRVWCRGAGEEVTKFGHTVDVVGGRVLYRGPV